MASRFFWLLLFGALLCMAPRSVVAAPFCTQITGIAPECIYYDADQCRRRANELKAICLANPAEFHLVTGNERYCLVGGDRAALCIYADRQTCEAEAVHAGQALCLDNIPSGEPQDAFRTEPSRRY